jgi:hypothetical protein
MNQYYKEKFCQSIIKTEQAIEQHVFWHVSDKEASYYQGKLDGLREVIRLIAIQIGKPMKDSESVVAYYKRWLSMEYSQTDIPAIMKSLEESIKETE